MGLAGGLQADCAPDPGKGTQQALTFQLDPHQLRTQEAPPLGPTASGVVVLDFKVEIGPPLHVLLVIILLLGRRTVNDTVGPIVEPVL